MSRKKQRKREWKEDIEEHQVALQPGEESIHAVIRQHFWSRQWWILIGFQSEDRVKKIFADISTKYTKDTELLTWPIVRMGKLTGKQKDTLLILFVKKTTASYPSLNKILSAHGSKGIGGPRTDQDFFPISWGYTVALIRVFEFFVRQGAHADN